VCSAPLNCSRETLQGWGAAQQESKQGPGFGPSTKKKEGREKSRREKEIVKVVNLMCLLL
jgi:hypothetical protein